MDNRFDDVLKAIESGSDFLVVSHVNPEGDAIGSTIGMTLGLMSLGKNVVAFLEDPLPDTFRFLPGTELVVSDIDFDKRYDAVFAVDCGQKERLGDKFQHMNNYDKIINIDHHATNSLFGDINVVDPSASAAGELVYDLMQAIPVALTKDMAENLYTSILTDTGSFRYSSVTPDAFRKAGHLVSLGADPWNISQRIYESYPVERFRLMAKVLETLELKCGNKLALLLVSKDTLESLDVDRDMSEGFVNYGRAINGVEVALLFREDSAGKYKVSLRSKGRVDVSLIAAQFGGGGHHNAAGCIISGGIDVARERVLGQAERVLQSLFQ